MKRIFILLLVALFAAGSLFAEEAVLIDFSLLKADILPDEQTEKPTQNQHTVMDYANVAGASYTDEQKALMKTSLAITNWDVVLSSSSRNVNTVGFSYTQETESKNFGTVMGVRIHFPVENFNSWAKIVPPFSIPAFEPNVEPDEEGNIPEDAESDGITGRSRFEAPEDGGPAYGVVKNVGTIKSVAADVYGLNFPHALSAILIDDQGNERIVFLGYLNFDGWAELRWDNPQYVQQVRNRELRLYPLYPASTPFVKFGGFLIQRDASKTGGDFVTYFKDVKIIYDKAVLDTERDIDDEGSWGIIKDRETARKTYELKQFGNKQVERYLDSQKQATEKSFTPTAKAEEQ